MSCYINYIVIQSWSMWNTGVWIVHGVFLHLSQVFTIKDMSFKAGMEMKVSGKTKSGCEACVHQLFNLEKQGF